MREVFLLKRFYFSIAAISVVMVVLSGPLAAQKPKAFETIEEAQTDPDFLIQGEYAGAGVGLQAIAVGDDDFQLVLYPGGLPGAGWNGTPPQAFEGDAATILENVKRREMKRVERSSPTLGAKPPVGATVLFDGTQALLEQRWESGAKRTEDGLLIQGATTKDKFRDYTLHLEFKTPYQPKATGQGRGNSGVYHQGRYETQILDSFGLQGKNNETGGIYEIRDPDLNMCFPPLAWQTYDIDFTAARFDDSGKKTSDAKLTVRLNGVVVQQETSVPKPTRAAPLKEEDSPGPLHLQDHGNPVRFRNIWVLPRDVEREALRPIVPGFERFPTDKALAGRVLISQLGCTACHANDEAVLSHKSAPILDTVASRLRPDYLVSFTGDPHRTKAGTTMPDLLHGESIESREKMVAALASFLSATGKLTDRSGDSGASQRGDKLFHTIGCAACHSPRLGDQRFSGTSVPLGDLTNKYTLDGLSSFLIDPLKIRESGSMPKLVKNQAEARDVACYLLGESIIAPGSEQFSVKVYHGSWEDLPNFDELKTVKTGTTQGLDLSVAGRKDNFGLRFETFLPISTKGEYTFHLGSDDGSRLLINDKELVKVAGIHPYSLKKAKIDLEEGVHSIRLEYFEGGGEERLTLEVEGPDIEKTPIANLVTADPNGQIKKELIVSRFRPNADLVEQGRSFFQETGCANCHQLKIENKPLVSKLKAKNLVLLRSGEGCLSEKVQRGLPDYALTRNQREAIDAALSDLAKPVDDPMNVHFQMAAKNCYACHSRGEVVGPEPARDLLFTTQMQEMGNEGRLPPPLTGVGDKLRPEIIDRILADGSKDRPYMLTRMPGFGDKNLPGLREALVKIDEKNSPIPKQHPEVNSEEEQELIAAGRKLTGNMGLSCIKCHRFGDKATPGLEAIDLLKMTERLREDWFRRYLLAPNLYRPGTRMPASFPDGKSVLTSLFDGDPHKQIDSMWAYLSQGKAAKKPTGLDVEAIVLSPDARPIMYRNFIEGLGPRGIGVGYPERVNLAWDAGGMNLALLWKNDFIDAGRHWTGRGAGNQIPLGDFVVPLESSAPVAQLESLATAWPTKTARQRGYQFLGYRLNNLGEPKFRYRFGEVEIEDRIRPYQVNGKSIGFERELRVKILKQTEGLVVRFASGQLRKQDNGSVLVDEQHRIRIAGCTPEILKIDDHQELRAALPTTGELTLTEWVDW